MKKSTKKGILIGAAAALAASLIPYELKIDPNGDFSYSSLLLGIYKRKRADGETALTITVADPPCFSAEAKERREAALRHSIEAAAERELFADEDDPAEGTAPAEPAAESAAPAEAETAPAQEAPAETAEEAAPVEEAPAAEETAE